MHGHNLVPRVYSAFKMAAENEVGMDIQTIPSYRHLAVIQADWIVSIQVNFKNGSESWSLWRQMRFPFSTINDNIYIYYVGVLQ